jgi:secretion/DNA translocation related TadE-like protein
VSTEVGDVARRREREPPDEPAAPAAERGVATVLAVGWVVVLLTAGWLAALAVAIAAAQHHLDGAADLAAFSAAASAQTGADPCATAARIARRNGVSVSECRREGPDVVVTVVGEVGLPLDVDGALASTARAGP